MVVNPVDAERSRNARISKLDELMEKDIDSKINSLYVSGNPLEYSPSKEVTQLFDSVDPGRSFDFTREGVEKIVKKYDGAEGMSNTMIRLMQIMEDLL